jgi:hypothetical protein
MLASCLLAGLAPARSWADKLVFHNDCSSPLVVQAVCLHRGIVQRERPYVLAPREASREIMVRGERIITIYDARCPNRVLYQGALPAATATQHFSILPEPPSPRVKLQRRLVPRS